MKNKLTLLTIALLLLTSLSCKKETIDDEHNPLPSQIIEYKISIRKNNILETEFVLNSDHKLKSINSFSPSGSSNTIEYLYTNDKKLDYSYNSTTGKDTVRYEYQNNRISKIIEESASYTVSYTSDGKPNIIHVFAGACGCNYNFEYNNNNVSDVYFKIPPGYITDSMQYDNYKNPFTDLWPYSIFNPLYLSANNITEHKNLRVEDTNYGTGQPPSWSVETNDMQYTYSYNSDSLPYEFYEYNLTTLDTNHYFINYSVNLL